MKAKTIPYKFKHDENCGKQFLKTDRVVFWICEKGYITRTFLKSFKEHYVIPYSKRGKAAVKIQGKEHILKHLIAEHFSSEYKKGMSVICIDGNEMNCDIENYVIKDNGSKVVLTIAHLDHTPENCNDENLRALCQKCHNGYDREHRNKTRQGA